MVSEQRQPLILVVDEVHPVVRLLELELNHQGMRTANVLINEDPMARAEELQPDAVVIGSMVPTPLLYDVLEKLSKHVGVPVVLISATANEADAAIGLQLGADDVIARPFTPLDLALRLTTLLGLKPRLPRVVERRHLKVDVSRRFVWVDGKKVELGITEWTLLIALIRSANMVPSADLLTMAWGPEYAGDVEFLAIWIDRLRARLGDDPANPTLVLGDPASGFCLVD
jgi:two-component system KDP operon response regulator KdpE